MPFAVRRKQLAAAAAQRHLGVLPGARSSRCCRRHVRGADSTVIEDGLTPASRSALAPDWGTPA